MLEGSQCHKFRGSCSFTCERSQVRTRGPRTHLVVFVLSLWWWSRRSWRRCPCLKYVSVVCQVPRSRSADSCTRGRRTETTRYTIRIKNTCIAVRPDPVDVSYRSLSMSDKRFSSVKCPYRTLDWTERKTIISPLTWTVGDGTRSAMELNCLRQVPTSVQVYKEQMCSCLNKKHWSYSSVIDWTVVVTIMYRSWWLIKILRTRLLFYTYLRQSVHTNVWSELCPPYWHRE